jgi:hypothetical protein
MPARASNSRVGAEAAADRGIKRITSKATRRMFELSDCYFFGARRQIGITNIVDQRTSGIHPQMHRTSTPA